MSKKRRWLSLRYLLPAAFFVVLAVFLLLGLGRNPHELPSPLIGKAAPGYRLAVLPDTPPPVFGPLPDAAAGTAADHQAGEMSMTMEAAAAGRGADAGTAAGTGADATGESSTAEPDQGSTAPSSSASSATTLDSRQLRGRPYLLNVWASWCAPCLQEHPQMLALAKARNIRLVGLNYKDQSQDALRWLKRHGNPFDQVVVDAKGRTAIDFGVYGVPETFLIDAEGQIRFKHVGPLNDEVLRRQLLPAIAALGGTS
ncbi:MAG: DsbE family thiol:disulfide interchange protein [Lautropia sp.]|nr:DsbE family thiol:disulfide interchange protein [Lautropia sp.]